jgi:hypothetical protein
MRMGKVYSLQQPIFEVLEYVKTQAFELVPWSKMHQYCPSSWIQTPTGSYAEAPRFSVASTSGSTSESMGTPRSLSSIWSVCMRTATERKPNGDRKARSLENEPCDSGARVPTPYSRWSIWLALGSTATSQVCSDVAKNTASFFWNVPTATHSSPVSCWSCTGRKPASLAVCQSRALPTAQYFTV